MTTIQKVWIEEITEFVDMFGHGETDCHEQHAGDDHQRRHHDHRTFHPTVTWFRSNSHLTTKKIRRNSHSSVDGRIGPFL